MQKNDGKQRVSDHTSCIIISIIKFVEKNITLTNQYKLVLLSFEDYGGAKEIKILQIGYPYIDLILSLNLNNSWDFHSHLHIQ